METGPKTDRRRKPRAREEGTRGAQLWLDRGGEGWKRLPAFVEDMGDFGLGVVVREPVSPGQSVVVEGSELQGKNGDRPKGHVAWCAKLSDGSYRAGLAIDGHPPTEKVDGDGQEDHYEVMEAHPSASFDTIHRVYRLLAQRLHPDNVDSGNEARFKLLVAAYKVISDPVTRAAYDQERTRRQARLWRIFDPQAAQPGIEQERRKRNGILALLFNKRMRESDQPSVGILEMEQLLGVPREHLEFPLWYLKEQALAARTDTGRWSITAKGVDHAEATGAWQPEALRNAKLLTAGPSR